MEIQRIPNSFWHSLSFAILVVSSGLTYIAYKSSNVSIELANAKIYLSSEVASSTLALSAALDEAKKAKIEAETKYKKLLQQHDHLKKQLAKIEDKANTNHEFKLSIDEFMEDCPECLENFSLPKELPFKNFDANILKAEQSLDKLQTLNKQIQPLNK